MNELDKKATMKVTVRELNDSSQSRAKPSGRLVAHARAQQSEMVLLPEIPYYPWFGVTPVFEARVWQTAVASHDAWRERLVELAPAVVLGTRPVNRGG